MSNPLLLPFNTPHQTPPFFSIEESHYLPAFEKALEIGKQEIMSIISNSATPTFENSVEALENTGRLLSSISEIFFNLNHAHTNENIQRIARETSPKLTEYNNDLWLNSDLFARIKLVYDQRDSLNLKSDQSKLLIDTYKAFVRKGAILNDKDKTRYREITARLSDITLLFSENVLAETNNFQLHLTNKEEIEGLPSSVLEAAAQLASEKELKGWLFTLHFPSYMPFMKYAKNRALRQKLYTAYATRGFTNNNYNNKNLVEEIASLRLEKAQILGFKNHASYVLEERMAQTPEKVNQFLNQLLDAALPIAKKEVLELEELAKSMGLNDKLQKWDFAFYSEILKAQKYSIDDQATKPYFELNKVEKGIFDLATQLFGITFKDSPQIPLYHNDAKAVEVYDKERVFLAVLYLDYYPRPSKQNGAWMTNFREQCIVNKEEIRPIVSLVMNFSMPTATLPSLLTFNEVKTFLHEFGHALHGMLSKVNYVSQAGTNVYRDFVELPSQWLENWATDNQWLKQTASHYETGEAIPVEIIEKLIESEKFQSGYATIRQLTFGMLDMAYHTITNINEANLQAIESKITQITELLPEAENTAISTAFSHIFSGGYAAGYYGYKWAEVLDADAFDLFLQTGTYNKETALSFQKTY
jgi:peptidyl-dipeptidase Dcp